MAQKKQLTTSETVLVLERSKDTVRAYERKGWLTPERTDGALRIRLFDRDQVEALKLRLAQARRDLVE